MTQEEFFKRYTYSIRTDKIGGGAFGTVYKAYDNILNRELAIKVSEVKTIGDKEFSLKDEFNAIKDLPVHPNIANYEALYTFEMPNGIFDYAIMQFYKDGNLSGVIRQKLTSEQKEQIALDLLQGIIHLHKHKVVHRDLKPSNILVAKRGDKIIPIITDFGLSKQTKQEAQSQFSNSFGGGTLKYSSPEQLKGNKLRLNTDLWAYGVIVYEIFTAQTLFNANTATGVSAEAEKEIYEQILNLNFASQIKQLPEKWQKAISLCLVRDASKRIKSAEELEGIILNKENTITEPKNQSSINEAKTKVETNSPLKKGKVSSDDKTIIEKPVASDKLPESSKLSSFSDSPKPKKKNKLLIPLISFAAVAIIVALFFILSPSEQADWQTAQEQNTIESYQQYISNYPIGKFFNEALEKIEEVKYSGNSGIFKDERDGQEYKWIKIGEQIWMAENLNYTGNDIRHITDNDEWANNTKYDAWCYYEETNSEYADTIKYGALYQWEAAKKACPPGWHLPSDAEWNELEDYLGSSNAGSKLAGYKQLWEDGDLIQNANFGATGFSALPSGAMGKKGCKSLGEVAGWWSSSEENPGNGAILRYIKCTSENINYGSPSKYNGVSARCIKD